jgi:hypothetical protein
MRDSLAEWASATVLASSHGSALWPSVAATVVLKVGLWGLGVSAEFWTLPAPVLTAAALLLALWFWLSLSASATALSVLRAGGRWRPVQLVALPKTFEVMLVTGAIAVPILAGIVFLIVPGVLLALYWSQSVYVLIEDRAAWFDAAGESYHLTSGNLSLILIAADASGILGLASLYHVVTSE